MSGVALAHFMAGMLRGSLRRAEGLDVMRADKIRKVGNQIKAAEMKTKERDDHQGHCPSWNHFTHYKPKNLLRQF